MLDQHVPRSSLIFFALAILVFASPYIIPPYEGHQGKLLVATSKLDNDPVFKKSIILVVRHDRLGAFGMIINRPFGGPMEAEHVYVLHRLSNLNIERNLSIQGTDAFITDNLEPFSNMLDVNSSVLILNGYSGWGMYQLDKEIKHGNWQVIPYDKDMVFSKEAHNP